MDVNAELKKIEDYLSGLSEEELDGVLFDCGIESIKPSIDSDYVKCLHRDLPNAALYPHRSKGLYGGVW